MGMVYTLGRTSGKRERQFRWSSIFAEVVDRMGTADPATDGLEVAMTVGPCAVTMPETSLSESRWSILFELRRHDELTIDELAESTGRSKTATRAHLVRMERDGLASRVSREAAGPGRPPVAFRLTDDGAALFPSDDDAVLARLIRFLDENGARDLVDAFFTEVWAERTSDLLDTLGTTDLGSASLDARLEALETTLTDRNFMPVIDREPRPDGSEIVSLRECNCPLPAAARASRIPCRLEVNFLARVLGARPQSVSIASRRRDSCRFEFVVDPAATK